jgi:hypothetical protein
MSLRLTHSSAKICTSLSAVACSSVSELPGRVWVWQPKPRLRISRITSVMNSPLSQLAPANTTGLPSAQ